MDNYKIEVSVEPYKGDLREEGNNFTYKEARLITNQAKAEIRKAVRGL